MPYQGGQRRDAPGSSRRDGMRSPRGFFAAVVMLLALPVTVLGTIALGGGDKILIHLSFAVGFALLATSFFDFKTARWVTWLACVGTGTMAAIFLLQGISDAVHSDWLHHAVYDVLGQSLESALIYVVILWCFALLLMDSSGKTRALGFVFMSLVLGVELVGFITDAPEILKVLYLPPFVWLMLESRKPRPAANEPSHTAVLAAA
jgi:hypothetical protein